MYAYLQDAEEKNATANNAPSQIEQTNRSLDPNPPSLFNAVVIHDHDGSCSQLRFDFLDFEFGCSFADLDVSAFTRSASSARA